MFNIKNNYYGKNFIIIVLFVSVVLLILMMFSSENANAGSYDGDDLARAILADESTLISSSYWDYDNEGFRQKIISTGLGTMNPTNGSTFVFLSTGIAGSVPVTTNGDNPGNERGTWYKNQFGKPRDKAELTMVLQIPQYMHFLYYDFQFFSAEPPEYSSSKYNDQFEVIVNSPSKGISTYICDVNSGNFVLTAEDIPGTGFDIFALSGDPDDVDIVDTFVRNPGSDAGATALVTRGGTSHPVSPNEQITVIFSIKDVGDNQFDSAVFLDNLVFLGYAKTDIIARKSIADSGLIEPGDTINYTIAISNIGGANQSDNPGNEFEDLIPQNTSYVEGTATATSGNIEYDNINNKIIWNGAISSESSVVINYRVLVNSSISNGTIISNQGTIFWDSNENGTNGDIELTDDTLIDDGIDQDGDGITDDDDPTDVIVITFTTPDSVTEDFSDDTPGQKAIDLFLGKKWFETDDSGVESNFEVVSYYHHYTDYSFKIKQRASGGILQWNYFLANLQSDIEWWEAWFKCGNSSEEYDLYLTLKNSADQDIAKIKFEYLNTGTDYLTDWLAKIYYYHPITGWRTLSSGYIGGYLYNGWYKLRIEKYGTDYIDYYIYNSTQTLVDFERADILSAPFSDLEKALWTSTKEPVACPIFFWDEHRLGLVEET